MVPGAYIIRYRHPCVGYQFRGVGIGFRYRYPIPSSATGRGLHTDIRCQILISDINVRYIMLMLGILIPNSRQIRSDSKKLSSRFEQIRNVPEKVLRPLLAIETELQALISESAT